MRESRKARCEAMVIASVHASSQRSILSICGEPTLSPVVCRAAHTTGAKVFQPRGSRNFGSFEVMHRRTWLGNRASNRIHTFAAGIVYRHRYEHW